jgi:hypothetical protein
MIETYSIINRSELQRLDNETVFQDMDVKGDTKQMMGKNQEIERSEAKEKGNPVRLRW